MEEALLEGDNMSDDMEDSMEDSEEEEEDITMEGEVDDSITLSKFQEGIRKETPVWKGSHMILKF